MLPTVRTRTFLPNFIDDFLERDFFPEFFTGKVNTTVPAINVVENKDEYKIEVAAPGLRKKEFKVDVNNNILVISSEKNIENEEKNENYVRKEFSYNKFCRSFSLPDEVDTDKISASHNEGVLEVHIPKKEEAKEKAPRQIKIS